MKILFYLPVITPWWFAEIIAPMLRTLHGQAELHVMVAPMWRGTGIEGHHLDMVADLPGIHWHVVEDNDPAPFRRNGQAVEGLLEAVHAIAPDLTLCRSADQATPARFPGCIRYIMEGGAAPFQTDLHWIVLEPSLFDYGAMPDGAADAGARIADTLAPLFRRAEHQLTVEPPFGWRAHFGIPQDRPVLLVPLQYEHEEDFFIERSAFPRGVDLIRHLIAATDDSVFLAVTDHPLNRRYVDRSAVDAVIAAHPDRARLCLGTDLPLGVTGMIAGRADAMLVDQSKSWSLAAFHGTPIVHVGTSRLTDWMNAGRDLACVPGRMGAPDKTAARQWFGWHLGTRLLEPRDFTFADLMARVSGTWDDATIAAGLDRMVGHLHRVAA